MSHQLLILRQLQLVVGRSTLGEVQYYRLNDDHIHNLLELALEHVQE